ncbi:MAG: CPBP family intramembrane metalloprotease [Candidatus Marinimicrobia bacterium]|nr:CPBP family intramembrane metalloprotease [Candidatus Neomarinimicrobiota bacterium]
MAGKEIRTPSEAWLPLLPAFLLPIFFFYFGRAESFEIFFGAPGAELSTSPIYYEWGFGILLFTIIPILIWTGVLGYSIKDIGIHFGSVKKILLLFPAVFIFILIYAYIAANFQEFHLLYPRFKYIGMSDSNEIIKYYFIASLFIFSHELFFRGFIIQGLKNNLGPAAAILISSMAAAPIFAASSIMEGTIGIIVNLLYATLAVRSGSFLYSALLAWIWMFTLDWMIIYGI